MDPIFITSAWHWLSIPNDLPNQPDKADRAEATDCFFCIIVFGPVSRIVPFHEDMTNSSALSSAHSSKASNRGCCIPVFFSPCSKTRSGEVRHFSSTGNFPHVECILTSTPSTADSPLLAVETATDPAANTAAPARIFFEGMFNAGDFRGICFFVEAGMNASLFPLATVLSNDAGEAQDCSSVISVKLALCGSCCTPFACAALFGHTAEAAKIPAARALPLAHFPILLPESLSILRHTVPLPVTMSASCRHSGMQRQGLAEFSFEPGVMCSCFVWGYFSSPGAD